MTKPFGLNVSFKTAAQLVKMPGSFTCAGGGVSDVCNGLLAKQNSVVFKPIVVLAIKYMWAVKSKTPISASLLGYEGANAETLIVDKKPGGGGGRRTADSQSGDGTANWNGICPFILPTMKEKFEHMARLPNHAAKDKGGFPKGTTKWPKRTDADILSVLDAVWLRIAAEAKKTCLVDEKTKAAALMGWTAWLGVPDGGEILDGLAAAYVRNSWSHTRTSKGFDWNPTALKKTLLDARNAASS